MKKRIAIDMDEVIADAVKKHIACYNKGFNAAITVDDLQGKKLRQIVEPDLVPQVISYLADAGFFRDLDVIEDSQEVIRELSKHYEIFIATAAMDFPTSFAAKYEWLKEHFAFIPDQNIVFCGNKSIIHADYLIDDNVRQLNNFGGEGILYTAPHNVYATGFKRVNNWREVAALFLGGKL